MIESRNIEVDVESLMRRIKSEIEHAGANSHDLPSLADDDDLIEQTAAIPSLVSPYVPVVLQPDFVPSPDGRYALADFLPYHDATFVRVAFLGILRREPDPDGYRHCIEMVRTGYSKVSILGLLRFSPEGRAAGVQVAGLRSRYVLQRLYQVPVAGTLLRIALAIWHLPEMATSQRRFESRVMNLLGQMQAAAQTEMEALRGGRYALEEALRSGLHALDEHSRVRYRRQRTYAGILQQAIGDLRRRVADVDSMAASLPGAIEDARRETLATAGAEIKKLAAHLEGLVAAGPRKEQIEALEQASSGLRQAVDVLQKSKADTEDIAKQVGELNKLIETARLDGGQELSSAIGALRQALDDKVEMATLESTLIQMHASKDAMANEESHNLDDMYASLEHQFRGSPADIKQRLSIYLPYVKEANAGGPRSPVIDLGCGRGEWLESLKEAGLEARGVDLNRVFLRTCAELDLLAVEQDAVDYLRGLEAGSVGAVTAFHLVEHLPVKNVVALLDETLRVLRSGGILIMETPNPSNLIVGACNFYIDPTHRNPLPSQLCQFWLEVRGFVDVQILPLHPVDADWLQGATDRAALTINHYMFGAQDYAVIGRKV